MYARPSSSRSLWSLRSAVRTLSRQSIRVTTAEPQELVRTYRLARRCSSLCLWWLLESSVHYTSRIRAALARATQTLSDTGRRGRGHRARSERRSSRIDCLRMCKHSAALLFALCVSVQSRFELAYAILECGFAVPCALTRHYSFAIAVTAIHQVSLRAAARENKSLASRDDRVCCVRTYLVIVSCGCGSLVLRRVRVERI